MAEPSQIGSFFAANFRRVRKQVGISQEALGFRAGLHRTEIGLLERGERVPRIDTLVKLAAGLGVDPAVLLDGIKWDGVRTIIRPGEFVFSEQGAEEHPERREEREGRGE